MAVDAKFHVKGKVKHMSFNAKGMMASGTFSCLATLMHQELQI